MNTVLSFCEKMIKEHEFMKQVASDENIKHYEQGKIDAYMAVIAILKEQPN